MARSPEASCELYPTPTYIFVAVMPGPVAGTGPGAGEPAAGARPPTAVVAWMPADPTGSVVPPVACALVFPAATPERGAAALSATPPGTVVLSPAADTPPLFRPDACWPCRSAVVPHEAV